MIDLNSIGEVRKPIQPGFVLDDLQPAHPWISRWVIRVSCGYKGLVGTLLREIEEIMDSPTPSLSFLRITEETVLYSQPINLSERYQRQLRIFVQAKQPGDARDQALKYVARIAANASADVCMYCGGQLELHDLTNNDNLFKYPFLPKIRPNQRDYCDKMAMVCMACAQQEYLDKTQADTDNFFGVFETEEEIVLGGDADDNENEIDRIERAADAEIAEVNAVMWIEDEIEKIQRAAESAREIAPVDSDSGEIQPASVSDTQVEVFSTAELDKYERDNKDAQKDQSARVKSLVKKLRATSSVKDLMPIPCEWRNFCDDLDTRFPNFREVVAFIRTQMALSAASDEVLRLPPFLLLGDPGIGKTEFALTLATELNSKLKIIDVASAQSSSGLAGSETYWSNSQPGAIFNSVVFNDYANGIIMLDELDKGRNDEHFNALSVLHQVLEPRQAKLFRDLSVPELTLDVSHIIWIATANNADTIEKQILDRFVTFNIAAPSVDQMPAIVINQYLRFIETHPSGKVFDETIGEDVLAELCKHHPRKVRKMLNQAFGLAAIEERKHLTIDDIKASESDDRRKRSIGFSAEIN